MNAIKKPDLTQMDIDGIDTDAILSYLESLDPPSLITKSITMGTISANWVDIERVDFEASAKYIEQFAEFLTVACRSKKDELALQIIQRIDGYNSAMEVESLFWIAIECGRPYVIKEMLEMLIQIYTRGVGHYPSADFFESAIESLTDNKSKPGNHCLRLFIKGSCETNPEFYGDVLLKKLH